MISMLYNLFVTSIVIICLPYIFLRALFEKAFRKEILQRFGFFRISCQEETLWVHAASAGEVVCTIPLVKRVKDAFPGIKVVLTTMTRTGQEIAVKNITVVDDVLFCPLDHPFAIQRTLRRINPQMLLIAETELWPNLVRSCTSSGIPVVIFNGRISERSFRRYRLLRFFFRPYLRMVSLFLMQTETDRDRIIEIGAFPERTLVTGNTKFDQPLPSWKDEDLQLISRSLGFSGNETILVAGSTHRGEEEILLQIFMRLRKKYPHLHLILTPRHLDRLEEVEGFLGRAGITWRRRTSFASMPENQQGGVLSPSEVLLIDTVGELPKLYGLASVVFVGGSLVPVGGHNPLEPLMFKKCVLFGPHTFHFSEISRLLIEEGGAIRVRDGIELLAQLDDLLGNEERRQQIGEKGFLVVMKHRGSTERIFQKIRPYLHG